MNQSEHRFAAPLAALFDRPLIWLLPFLLGGIHQGWQSRALSSSSSLTLALGLSVFYLLWRKIFRPGEAGRRLSRRPAAHGPGWGVALEAILAASVFFLGWGLCAKSLDKPESPKHIANKINNLNVYEASVKPPPGGRFGNKRSYDDASPWSERKHLILGGVAAEGTGGRPGSNYRLLLKAKEIILPGPDGPLAVEPTYGLVRLSVGSETMDVEVGDYLRMPVILRPIAGFKNPGTMDYERYWRAQGVLAGGFIKSPALVTSWPGFSTRIARWRTRAENFIKEKTSPAAAGILSAQLVGKRGAVAQDKEKVFRNLGLSHLLAVSGLHLGLCYALAFWLSRLGLNKLGSFIYKIIEAEIKPLSGGRRFRNHRFRGGARPPLGRSRQPRIIKINILAAGLALIPTFGYAALVGTASPVLRASLTIAAVVLATVLLRRSDPWNILAAAAWALLLIEPQRLFSASFQLSFTATAAMLAVFVRRPGAVEKEREPERHLLLSPLDGQTMARLWARLVRRGAGPPENPGSGRGKTRGESFFKKSLLAALAGSIGAAPLVAWHFTWLPLAGIPANLIFTPLLTFFVLSPGLLGLCLLPLSSALAGCFISLAGTVLTALLPVMELAAEAAGPGLALPAPGPFFLIAFYLGWWIWLRGAAPLARRLPPALLIIALGFAPGLIKGPGDKGVLRLTVLDVGQGAATHVNLPDGSQMLIDGGGTNYFDPGERIIAPYLSRQGLRRLDVVALTHPDQDHLKGLVFVTEHFKPREIWDAPWPGDHSSLYRSFRDKSSASRRPELSELYRGRKFGPAEVRLLWPKPDHQWSPDNIKEASTNDSNLVFQIRWGEDSFLITGDISKKVEKELISLYGRELESTVLLAPHHGSRNSLSREFMDAVKAGWIVFSAGRDNSAGLPHPETIQRAEEYGAAIWRTDLNGAAVFEVREKEKKISTKLIQWRGGD